MTTVRGKIIGLALIAALIALFSGLSGVFGMRELKTTVDEKTAETKHHISALMNVDHALTTYKNQVLAFKNLLVRGNDRSAYDKLSAEFDKLAKDFLLEVEETRADIAKAGMDPAITKKLDEAVAEHRVLTTAYSEAIHNFKIANPQAGKEADKMVVGKDRATSKVLTELQTLMNKDTEEQLKGLTERIDASYTGTRTIVIALVIVGFIVVIALSYWIGRSILRPLSEVMGVADALAAGDLSRQLTIDGRDELNQLKQSIQSAQSAVKALVVDAKGLAAATAEGRLEERADAQQHAGEYREIVVGLNATMEAMANPIGEIQRVLAAVAEGDMTQSIDTRYAGDFDTLKNSLNETVVKLAETIRQVQEAAEGLNNASQQVSSTAQSLSQNASEQAASVEETSASVEQMSSSIAQNTENAKVTDGMASKSAQEAQEGGTAVKETMQAMREIAGKIKIVDDIAYKTNLLAFNAAIEAARAGEHGKGFAVVAEEVRNLAERSQTAAQEIGGLAASSVERAERAGRLLDEMVPSIMKTSSLVQEIAAASKEQASGVGQINGAMNQVNQTTQAAASASEELAATAEELSGQAEQLSELMSFFRVEQGIATRANRRPTHSDFGATPKLKAGAATKTKALPAATAEPDERHYVRFA